MTQISFKAYMFIDDSGTNHHSKLSNALIDLFIYKAIKNSHLTIQSNSILLLMIAKNFRCLSKI